MNGEVPRVVLGTADYLVMGFYFAGLLAVGLYFRRFAQKDVENYFLAGRKLPGWLNGVSYAATCMNADVAPAYCGMTVICGLFICWWYISRFGLALMIGAVLFAFHWRRLRIFTSPEFYEMRFSGVPAVTMRSWISLRSAFIAVVAWTGSGLLGLHKVFHALLGWEKGETFAVVIPVILFYVLLSGYIGVVITDLFQTLIMIGSSIALMVLVLHDFGGPAALGAALAERFGPAAVSWHPPMQHELLGVIGVIAWTVGTAVGYGGDVAPMAGAMEGQRILSSRDAREASKMYIWTEIVLFFMLAVLTLPALGAMVRWPGLHDGGINRELAYGMLLGHYLPAGLLGLAIIAIAASIMSTVDSNLNFGAQVFLNDVYRRLIARTSTLARDMNVGRIVMFAIMGLAILVSTIAENVIDISVFMLGLSSAELTANWGQWWWWRFNGKARLAASFGGPAIFLLIKYVVFGRWIKLETDVEYVVVFSSMALTCVLWVAVALLTKPEPKETLLEFYRRARPPGWWGPIAREAGESAAGPRPILTGLGLAALGAVAVAAGTIAFSALYIARWWIAAAFGAAALLAGLAFRNGYRRRFGSAPGGVSD